MGASASVASAEEIAAMDDAAQREKSDALFTKLDLVADGKLNLLELKKGFEQLEEEGVVLKLSAKKFSKVADEDGDRMVDRDEFYAVMKKVFAKGDIEIGAAPEKTVIVVDGAGAGTAVAAVDAASTDAVEAAAAAAVAATPAVVLGSGADDQSRVSALFAAMDLNRNGELSLPELETFLGPDAQEVLAELDPTGAKGSVSAAAWADFFAALPDDARAGYLMTLEEIVASKDLSSAAPPPAAIVLTAEASAKASDAPQESAAAPAAEAPPAEDLTPLAVSVDVNAMD